MASIGRRGFVKGATLGALAFSVGGVEVLMGPGEARARNVPFRLLDGDRKSTRLNSSHQHRSRMPSSA